LSWRKWLVAGAAGLIGVAALLAGTVCVTSGCSSLGYIGQSVSGHLTLLDSAKPVADWLRASDTPPPLKTRLELSQRMRDFAVRELKLPDNRSYRTFADLHRPAAVWNVAAAPELSLKLQTWCYPVVGCVGYRGFYELASAEAEGEALRQEGLEVTVYPVPAYSTLGKMNWLGGDPLLNTFIQWPEVELARLIFHELSHQVVYAPGDTMFNESFATTVERLGGERWLAAEGSELARKQAGQIDERRADARRVIFAARAELEAIYASDASDEDKRLRKAEAMARMRAGHEALKAGPWKGYTGYDAFFAKANNASLGIQAAYLNWVPALTALFEREGSDFERFYAAATRLAALPRAEREATLVALAPAMAASSPDHPQP
jgi:predicted aminopeptidase